MVNESQAEEPDARAEQALLRAFSPHAPINKADLFRGRVAQVREVVDTVSSEGLHAVIYGERGVGKTSLANTIGDYMSGRVSVSKVICSQGESFTSVVRRALGSIQLAMEQSGTGFTADRRLVQRGLIEYLPESETIVPDQVAALLSQIPLALVIIVDEFDRLGPVEAATFADLIKALSDRSASTTVVLVGVAEDVNSLLGSHASVVRSLRQIRLPRMSNDELREIIDKGLADSGFRLDSPIPAARIISVSQGFPHYTHLLTLYAARHALDNGRVVITDEDVLMGMLQAVERADQSNRDLFYRAATGARRNSLWQEVVTACALCRTDDRGYFAIRDVQDEMSKLLNRPVKQQTVAYHLGKLTESDHGPLLELTGPPRRSRYRFINSLMRPFILMKAMNDGLISTE